MLISHAHNDHIGRLPLLVRQGYPGQVYVTEPTRLILPVILEDSLKLMQEERERQERKGREVPPCPGTKKTWPSSMAAWKRSPTTRPRAWGHFVTVCVMQGTCRVVPSFS